jgi:hypothetical protein
MKCKKDEEKNAKKADMDEEKTHELYIVAKNLHNIMNGIDDEEIVDMKLEEEEEEEECYPAKKREGQVSPPLSKSQASPLESPPPQDTF